jgi:hypothetical protein
MNLHMWGLNNEISTGLICNITVNMYIFVCCIFLQDFGQKCFSHSNHVHYTYIWRGKSNRTRYWYRYFWLSNSCTYNVYF